VKDGEKVDASSAIGLNARIKKKGRERDLEKKLAAPRRRERRGETIRGEGDSASRCLPRTLSAFRESSEGGQKIRNEEPETHRKNKEGLTDENGRNIGKGRPFLVHNLSERGEGCPREETEMREEYRTVEKEKGDGAERVKGKD